MTAGDVPSNKPAPVSPAQLRSRRILLLAFSFIFIIWVGMMIAMYFGTIYRTRHPAPSPSSSLPTPGTAS